MSFDEDIKDEIKIVEERIASKKKLLLKYPEDKGLALSLMSFEKRKDDLLFELDNLKDKTLHEKLDKIRDYILNNKQMQEKYPEEKEKLQLILKGLEKQQNEIFKQLNAFYEDYNLKVFDMKIESNKNKIPSINEITGILNSIQDMCFSLGESVYKRVKKGTQISDLIINSLSIGINDVQIGSLKLELKPVTSQTELVPYLGIVLDRLNDLINCEDNVELLEKQAKRLGSKPIYNYKEFLEIIKHKNLTISFFENIKPSNYIKPLGFDKKIVISSSFANKVDLAIDKIKPIKTQEIKNITGFLDVINGRQNNISVNLENEKKTGKYITINFDKDRFNEIIGEKYNKSIKMKVKVTEIESIVDNTKINYELLEILN
ncbi:MAG: hypothetical protein LBM96_01815 [Methanobrevibacter sp.]|jgi:hypothetical protein|nr:hypothetical protein [Candidatus Methanoflexus mossambicus]